MTIFIECDIIKPGGDKVNYIKKFKNGKVKLFIPKNDSHYRDLYGEVIEEFYFDEIETSCLYIVEIEWNYFIIDFETNKVYDYYPGYLIHNPLKYLLDELALNNKLYLYPLSKRESKEFLKKYYKEQLEEFGWL